jgi:phosphoribosylanthranilate isomerase
VEKVGVFVNQADDSICSVADQAGLSAIQMHGDNENPHVADLIAQRRPDLKIVVGISMRQAEPDGRAMTWSSGVVHAFLADSGGSSRLGGTGETFDWQKERKRIEEIASLGRVIVAGGLTPDNVPEAMRILKPWGVDVSSGVESKPGKKDTAKVQAFVAAVRQAERPA